MRAKVHRFVQIDVPQGSDVGSLLLCIELFKKIFITKEKIAVGTEYVKQTTRANFFVT